MNPTQQTPETLLYLDDDDIDVRLTKLEKLLEELKKSDEEKEAV